MYWGPQRPKMFKMGVWLMATKMFKIGRPVAYFRGKVGGLLERSKCQNVGLYIYRLEAPDKMGVHIYLCF